MLSNVSSEGERPPCKQKTYMNKSRLRKLVWILIECKNMQIKRSDLTLNKRSERQVIKEISKMLPDACISIFP